MAVVIVVGVGRLASTVVGNSLLGASGRAFVIEGLVVGSTDREVNLGADARAFRGGRQTSALIVKLSLVTLQVAEVVIGLSVLAANSGEVSNAVDALLNRSGIATTLESALNLGAVELAFVNVVFAINTADRLEDEAAFARGLALVSGLESSLVAFHNTTVLIGDSIGTADIALDVGALALGVGSQLVVEVVARTKLDSGGAVALGSAKVTVGDSVGGTDRIVIVVAGAGIIGDRSESQETGFFSFSKRIDFFGRNGGSRGVAADAPAIVSLGDTSEIEEAFVLIGLAINTADRTINDGASRLGGEEVWLSHEVGDVDQRAESIVSDGGSGSLVLSMNEHGTGRDEHQHQNCCLLSKV